MTPVWMAMPGKKPPCVFQAVGVSWKGLSAVVPGRWRLVHVNLIFLYRCGVCNFFFLKKSEWTPIREQRHVGNRGVLAVSWRPAWST